MKTERRKHPPSRRMEEFCAALKQGKSVEAGRDWTVATGSEVEDVQPPFHADDVLYREDLAEVRDISPDEEGPL